MSANVVTVDRAAARELVADPPRFLAALDRVDVEGWNGPAGDALLAYALREVVHPVARSARLSATETDSAIAVGWSAAWEAMRSPAIRDARAPWGAVTVAVRRAIFGEEMAERYQTEVRRAWRVRDFVEGRPEHGQRQPSGRRDAGDRAAAMRPVSLTAMIEQGYEPPVPGPPSEDGAGCDVLIATLARGGWAPSVARAAVLHVADEVLDRHRKSTVVAGWRGLAVELGIPPWQARRLTVLLMGTRDWSGLVERLATGGEQALHTSAVEAAVRASLGPRYLTPQQAALAAESRDLTLAAVAS